MMISRRDACENQLENIICNAGYSFFLSLCILVASMKMFQLLLIAASLFYAIQLRRRPEDTNQSESYKFLDCYLSRETLHKTEKRARILYLENPEFKS